MPPKHTYIILLNWNGWTDTIECLESVFRLDYSSYTVIVCDNASSDDSFNQIRLWAEGTVIASCKNPEFARLTAPPIPKPIPFVSYSRPHFSMSPPTSTCPLVLIQNGSNLGFAGGCNVGLRYALAQADCEYVWLLNNDTVVETDALSQLAGKMEAESNLGICGSVLLDYFSPRNVQAIGGRRYSVWSGRVLPQGSLELPCTKSLQQPIDYVHGASMLVRQEFLRTVGLLDERYFLYFEELDWAMRAAGHFALGYSQRSFVYHKEGASIGTNAQRTSRSLLSEWYATRNRLLITRKFNPALVPSVLAWVLMTAIQRLLIGAPRRAGQIVAAAWDGLTCAGFSTHEPGEPSVDHSN